MGIHGVGHIGKEVVKLLQPYGVKILACDREDFSDFYRQFDNVEKVGAEELWARSEVLTIHLSKNQSTIGMYTREVQAKLKQHNITPMAYGVVQLSKNEESCRKVFVFAKALGIRVINTESVDAIDTFEKLVKEFDIMVGFHDHPKQPNNPNYKMWDPEYILSVVKDRDVRIGSCADTGHWVRSGLKPAECIKTLKGRIVSSHLKDLHAPLPSGHDVPYGTGVSDVKAILDEFKAQGFAGPISVEYEHKQDNNLDDVKLCIDYVRDYGTKK